MRPLQQSFLREKTYPWEVLPEIGDFIIKLGKTLDSSEYEEKGENVWIARSATVAPTASITGPAIIGRDAEVRHCAFIRGKAIVGEGAVVGNSTELKNVQCCLTRFRFLIIIMLEMLCWDISPTWVPDRSVPT